MTSLHYLDPHSTGKPAILLLHGLGATGDSWAMQLPILADSGFRPIAPDVPGFGDSPYDGRGWTFRRMAEELAGLLEELNTGPVFVIGLSMGGVIAQQFGRDFPHLTKKLVLASTFSVLRPDNLSGWLYFLQRALVVTTLGLRAQGRVVARRVFPEPEQAALRELLEATISTANPRAYRAAMRSLGTFDSRKWLNELKMPTLVVTGAEDTTVSPARQKLLLDCIPGARQIILEKAGHAISVDRAEVFNREVLEFLKQ